MNPVLKFHEDTKEWVLHTPVVLNLSEVDRVVKFTKEIYKKRIAGLVGEKKRNAEYYVSLLTSAVVRQQLNTKTESTLFFTGKY